MNSNKAINWINYNVFPELKYRQGCPISSDFGFRYINDKLSFHVGLDHATVTGCENIHSPFDIETTRVLEDYGAYGNMLILYPKGADFEIRIGHIDFDMFDINVGRSLKLGIALKQDIKICPAGSTGMSTGPHTHTEIVSKDKYSTICEIIGMENHGLDFILQNIPQSEAEKEALEKKNIRAYNDHKCARIDYLTGKKKTFYRCNSLFNFGR